jgi:hypothetical protein
MRVGTCQAAGELRAPRKAARRRFHALKQAVAFRGIFQLAKARLNATFTVPLTRCPQEGVDAVKVGTFAP